MKPPIYAVIVAGGSGTRMGNAVPKQFLPLLGKPILYYSIKAFLEADHQIQLILVLPELHLSYTQMILKEFPERLNLTLVTGGKNRFESVKNGLSQVPENALVLVHDGVRALVSVDLIKRCIAAASSQNSAIPIVDLVDSIREIIKGDSQPADRTKFKAVQTPQAFQARTLKQAFQQKYLPHFTDEATVMEAFGEKLYLINGDKQNIKITTPEDLWTAEAYLNHR